MKKEIKFLLGIIGIGLIFRLFIAYFLSIKDIAVNALFISDILGNPVVLSWWINIILGSGNIILIYLISRKIFSKNAALFSSLIYAVSPWTAYIELTGTSYIFILFLTLIFSLGIILNHQKNRLGVILVTGSTVLLLLSSFFYLIILPVLLIALGDNLRKSKTLISVLLLTLLLCLSIIFSHPAAFMNHFKSQFTITSDIGIVNSVNTFRGDVMKTQLNFLGKIIENRYLYFTEKLVFNFLDQFSPSVYFTSQDKLLNFSFSPPIFLGFLLPFLFGLAEGTKVLRRYYQVIISLLILTIPSVFSKTSPDLIRLIIFSPALFIVIGLGLDNFYHKRRNKVFKVLILITIILIGVQLMVTISDIILREPIRIQKFI